MSQPPFTASSSEVNAKHLNTILENLENARKDVKSRHQDLLNAFNKHEKLIIGKNTTAEFAKCTYISGILEDPDPPKIDASCFSFEKRKDFSDCEQTIVSATSYYVDISAYLIDRSKSSNIVNNLKLDSPQFESTTQVAIPHKSIWRSLLDKVTYERPERRKFEKSVGIFEAKFEHLQLAFVLCNRYFDQRNNKFMNIAIEHQNPRALAFLILKDLRNFQHMQKTILSVLDFGYRLDLDKRLEMQAQTARSMIESNRAAQEAAAAASRAGQVPQLRDAGNGIGYH